MTWLAGLISADGWIEKRKSGSLAYYIASVEKEWLEQIQKELALFGIESTIQKNNRLYIKNPKRLTRLMRQYALPYLMKRKAKLLEDAYEFEFANNEIQRLINDPCYFAERSFNIKLYRYQKEILKAIAPRRKILIIKGRKIGITFLASIACLWWACTHSHHIVSIVSLFKRQAKVTLRFITRLLLKNQELLYELVDMPYGLTKESIRFRNGSIIQALGCNRPYGDNLRSEEAHFLVVDECILLYDKQWDAVEPLTAHSHGPEIYITTAGGEGSYMHRLLDVAKRDPNMLVFELPACKRTNGEITDILCPDMTKERLQKALAELKPLAFDREYCCKWIGLANQVFTKIPILKIGEELEVTREYYAGVDVGQVENPTVLTVIRGDNEKARVVFTREWRRATSNRELANNIYQALKRFNPIETTVDTTGLGIGLFQELEYMPLTFHPVKIKPQSKNQLIFDLQAGLNEEKLWIREDQDQLLYELRNFFAELMKGTDLYQFTSISTDDYVLSLALAWHALQRSYQGAPQQLRMVVRK